MHTLGRPVYVCVSRLPKKNIGPIDLVVLHNKENSSTRGSVLP